MAKSKNLYRGYSIERVGHGKKAVFQTVIDEKEWAAVTEAQVKTGIDDWIDRGIAPQS
jgi:hypothetical protein